MCTSVHLLCALLHFCMCVFNYGRSRSSLRHRAIFNHGILPSSPIHWSMWSSHDNPLLRSSCSSSWDRNNYYGVITDLIILLWRTATSPLLWDITSVGSCCFSKAVRDQNLSHLYCGFHECRPILKDYTAHHWAVLAASNPTCGTMPHSHFCGILLLA
jgi:hypothetical protein